MALQITSWSLQRKSLKVYQDVGNKITTYLYKNGLCKQMIISTSFKLWRAVNIVIPNLILPARDSLNLIVCPRSAKAAFECKPFHLRFANNILVNLGN